MVRCSDILRAAWRRVCQIKHVDSQDTSTNLNRCLSLKRLTFIGVGKTVGVGIYVLIGVATKEYAGPSVILAFLLAFVVTLLDGLCFAEFASRNPKTGAQYTYMYEAVGEAVAYLVGWTTMLGMISAFSLASRGWSGYVDSLFDHAIKNYTVTHVANWTVGPPFPSYPDFPAIFIILVVMVITSLGVHFSTLINAILAACSGILLIFIIICGLFYANLDNWTKVEGGFFPYGIKGVLKASSACFYAFQGFEILGFSAEETINPKKNIPRAIILVLLIVTTLYIGVAVSFTLMVPYTEVNIHAPFPGAFHYNDVSWAKYIVSVGPLFALSNLCVLEMYTISRLCFSMSEDGLLFKFLSIVNKKTKVPVFSVLVIGPLGVLLVLSIELSNLIGFMVTYSFIQYGFFAAYMIVLRYEPKKKDRDFNSRHDSSSVINGDTIVIEDHTSLPSTDELENSENLSTKSSCVCLQQFLTVKKLVLIIYVSCFVLALLLVEGSSYVSLGNPVAIFGVIVSGSLILGSSLVIWMKEELGAQEGFRVPLMPFAPVLCIFVNMVMLISAVDRGTFIASVTMAAIGAVIYIAIVFFDVIKNPTTDMEQYAMLSGQEEEERDEEEEEEEEREEEVDETWGE